jgi:cytochrome c oxidase subunit 4
MSRPVHPSAGVPEDVHAGPGPGLFVAVWAALVALTALLVLISHFGQTGAVWGLLLITPFKAGLVFYFFMHLKYEGLLLKGIVAVALGTLLIFFALLFADVAFR